MFRLEPGVSGWHCRRTEAFWDWRPFRFGAWKQLLRRAPLACRHLSRQQLARLRRNPQQTPKVPGAGLAGSVMAMRCQQHRRNCAACLPTMLHAVECGFCVTKPRCHIVCNVQAEAAARTGIRVRLAVDGIAGANSSGGASSGSAAPGLDVAGATSAEAMPAPAGVPAKSCMRLLH